MPEPILSLKRHYIVAVLEKQRLPKTSLLVGKHLFAVQRQKGDITSMTHEGDKGGRGELAILRFVYREYGPAQILAGLKIGVDDKADNNQTKDGDADNEFRSSFHRSTE